MNEILKTHYYSEINLFYYNNFTYLNINFKSNPNKNLISNNNYSLKIKFTFNPVNHKIKIAELQIKILIKMMEME